DFTSFSFLIQHLQRRDRHEESYEIIKKLRANREDQPLPAIYLKLEGLSLLQMGKEEEALACFKKYRKNILRAMPTTDSQEEENKAMEAALYSEVASVAHVSVSFHFWDHLLTVLIFLTTERKKLQNRYFLKKRL